MKVAIISGSPRKGKNSEQILESIVNKLNDAKIESNIIKLSQTKVKPCIHCDFCKKNSYCNHDENANKVNELLAEAHGIIAISPVYFGSISGQLKSLFDKTFPLRRNGFKLKAKLGLAVVVGGARSGGQELAIQNIHTWMLIHGMMIMGDNNHFGGTLQAPWAKDEFGSQTLDDSIHALMENLSRFKVD